MDDNSAGILDEALVRLYATGPELRGWLSNHGTMTVEALARHGQAAAVHRWLDGYVERLEDPPAPYGRITAENWREALGDPRYLADWAAFFAERLAGGPWREVLAAWWPRLLPGIAAGATHPVIRVGHAVRLLLTDGENGPRRAELAQGLGYWAARHQPLPAAIAPLPAPAGAGAALRAVPMVPEQSGGINHRLEQITALPAWAAAGPADPDAARRRLAELVRAAAARYATHGHGEPVMLVHAVTAPNAVLRCLPAEAGSIIRAEVENERTKTNVDGNGLLRVGASGLGRRAGLYRRSDAHVHYHPSVPPGPVVHACDVHQGERQAVAGS